MWISEQEHLRQFLDGADWFVDNQDDNGGWPSQVRSKQTNNQNVINKSKKNRMNRLSKFFLPGHVQSREQKVSRSGRGCPWVVRCNVSGAKFARKQMNTHKNNFITGSLLIFKDEVPCSMHSNMCFPPHRARQFQCWCAPTCPPGTAATWRRPLGVCSFC